MRYLSVCSGIEAATLAWHPLGWQPVAFAEVDKFPSAVLAHHYPTVPNWGDITKFRDWPDADVDVLVGGTPCQDYSVAGLRAGMAGNRGSLTLTFVEIAAHYRPRWLVWENVPGVFSSNSGRDFARLLGDLSGQKIDVPKGGWQNSGIVAGIGDAYGLAWRVLDAQYVRTRGQPWAVPQRRRRVFVVGHLGDWRRAAAVLLDRESLSGNPAPRRKAGERAAPTIASRPTGGGGLGTDFDCDGGLIAKPLLAGGHTNNPLDETLVIASGQAGAETGIGVGTALTCLHEAPIVAHAVAPPVTHNPYGDHESETFVAHALRGEGHDASEDGTGRGVPLVPVAFPTEMSGTQYASAEQLSPALSVKHTTAVAFATTQITSPGNYSQPAQSDPCHPLAAGAHPPAVAFTTSGYGAEVGDVASTMQASFDRISNQVYGVLPAPWVVRRLTPRECERLQGFPDDFTRIPYRGKPADQCPDGPRYKALGNSMAVNVMEWIGQRIALVEALR